MVDCIHPLCFQLLEGSMLSGELLFCGGTNWDLIGRKAIPKGSRSHYFWFITSYSYNSRCKEEGRTFFI